MTNTQKTGVAMLAATMIAAAQPMPPETWTASEPPETPKVFLASLLWNGFDYGAIVTVSNAATNYTNHIGGSSGVHPIWVVFGTNSITMVATNAGAISNSAPAKLTAVPFILWRGAYQASTNGIHWQSFNSGTQDLTAPIQLVRGVSWTVTNWSNTP